MEISVVEGAPEEIEADVLVFSVADPVALPAAAQALDHIVEGRLTTLAREGELKGEEGWVTLLRSEGRVAARRIGAAGLGNGGGGDPDRLRTAAGATAVRMGEVGGRSIAWILDPDAPLSPAEQARAIVDGTAIGPYEAGRWKSNGDAKPQIDRLVLCGAGGVTEEAQRTAVVAEWTNRCRDLVNAPPNELTPEGLAEWAEQIAGQTGLRFEVLGPEEIRAAGMGALSAVSQGSDNPPRLISLVYEPDETPRPDFRLGLVGKAITFDAGGLSLKPAERMDEMKSDMGGGAAVLAATAAIAELRLPLRVLTVVPSCENMPGGHAYRPGDIIRALNGKTIEVTNTDAEGRLILADALWYTRESGVTHMIDLATLTGAMVVAMGDYYAGLFGNDPDWIDDIQAAAEASGDHVWPWPLHDTYRRYIESAFADLKNSSTYRQGSPILAARFLQEFVGEGPWAHLDIAGTAYLERGRGDYYRDCGATGYGVRLLAELARRLSA
jgi:leucyl aminopeptidase